MTTDAEHERAHRVLAREADTVERFQSELDRAEGYTERASAWRCLEAATHAYGGSLTDHLRLHHGGDFPAEPWATWEERAAHHDALHEAGAVLRYRAYGPDGEAMEGAVACDLVDFVRRAYDRGWQALRVYRMVPGSVPVEVGSVGKVDGERVWWAEGVAAGS